VVDHFIVDEINDRIITAQLLHNVTNSGLLVGAVSLSGTGITHNTAGIDF
jgi:hypothetical protein